MPGAATRSVATTNRAASVAHPASWPAAPSRAGHCSSSVVWAATCRSRYAIGPMPGRAQDPQQDHDAREVRQGGQ